MNRFYLLSLWVGLLSSTALGQTVIVDDDFEYADEAALHAVWAGLSGTTAPVGTPAQVEERFVLVEEPGGINADFNGDNTVDAADYPVWRKSINTQPEYDAWVEQFGGPPSGGGPGNKYVNHLANTTTKSVPDGDLRYVPLLDPNFVEPGYPGGDGSIFPSLAGESIVLRGDIFATSALQRNTIGLRYFDGGTVTQNLFEMGIYNTVGSQPANPAGTTGAAVDGAGQGRAFAAFAIRAQLFGLTSGVNPDWQQFAFDPLWDSNANGLVSAFEAYTALGIAGTSAWHTLEATFDPPDTGTSGDITLTVTLDLLRDGMNNAQNVPGVDATITITNLQVTQAGFNSLRIGGPSALHTTVEMGFDNLFLSGPQVVPMGAGGGGAVPEPSAIGLALFAMAGLVVAGRRTRS